MLALASGGTIEYTPAAGFSGVDTFTYTVGDGRGGSAGAMVTVTVGGRPNRVPVRAADDNAIAGFGSSVTIPALANDSDADGDTLSIASVGTPAHGTASISGQGIVHADARIQRRRQLHLRHRRRPWRPIDRDDHDAVAALPNRNPFARADATAVTSGQLVVVDVLANDNDPDGDTIALASVGTPLHGAAAIFGGQIQYVSTPGCRHGQVQLQHRRRSRR